jgi:translation initiation factor IF-2
MIAYLPMPGPVDPAAARPTNGNLEEMTDNNDQETKRPLSLARPAGGRLELKKPLDSGQAQVRQSFPHGRTKTVTVEVKKKRAIDAPRPGQPAPVAAPQSVAPASTPSATRPLGPVTLPPRVTPGPAPVAAPPRIAPLPPRPVAEAPAANIAAAPTPASEPIAAVPASNPVPEAVIAQPVEEIMATAAQAPTPAEPPPVRTTPAPTPVATAPVATAPAGAPGNRPPPRTEAPRPAPGGRPGQPAGVRRPSLQTQGRTLTEEERASRMKALQGMSRPGTEIRRPTDLDALRRVQMEDVERHRQDEARRKTDEETRRKAEEEAKRRQEDEAKRREESAARKKAEAEDESRREVAERAGKNAAAKVAALTSAGKLKGVVADVETDESAPRRGGPPGARPDARRPVAPPRAKADPKRRTGKITISRALSDDEGERMRSLASVRRQREKMRQHQVQEPTKIVRDVVIPETITVQELAQRMAERGTDVIKALMRIGVMATLNQVIDADTAELVVTEFGHNLKRVAEADVEIGLKGEEDVDIDREPRPPVVTIMGHVDHGKTSLLDALRQTDVVAGEAGGITQHIGAYQVTMASGRKITFIDTPGHQAFTAMRARGANVTDIVVLVVAADDGIKDQTIEAIRHARAANAPLIVAINKIDKPGADPNRVRQELLQHEVVVEEMSGDVLDVEVSATKKINLDKLEEAILLQAELLDLRANPNRSAEGAIIEARLERGRGAVATVLIQRGTLHVGDIFVAGGEWGRVRALLDDRGNNIKEAGPGTPVEVLGLNGAPLAGDDFSVVDSEPRARDITEFRQRKKREAHQVASGRSTLEEMFTAIAAGTAKELPVVIKSDVQGSLEAITASLKGLSTDEVSVRILTSGVGGINESDVNLAGASKAFVIGFNVRANPQARDLARRDGIDIRYYSIIYDVIDDVKKTLEGLLSPTLKEQFLGNAQIREVFDITKVGKVAGCMITEGVVRRGSKVRLLRDDIVIHEGTLKTLKRFKDEVKEVREGFECGMAFENYTDIQVGDIIECFDIEEIARVL